LINNYRTRPKNELLSDPGISSEITPSINSHEFDSGFDSISGSNKETTKKEKSKGKKTKISNNGKTVKIVDPDMPEMIREKTEPLGRAFRLNFFTFKNRYLKKLNFSKSRIQAQKSEIE
jgi:hypothetical protein